MDWTKLAADIVPETGRIPYKPNKHLFRKVAFDVFQLNSSPVESLWTLEDGEDGNQFLVAQYNDEGPDTLEVESNWKALSDRDGKNVTLIYKNSPIQRLASSDYGFDKDNIHLFQQTLVEKLGSDSSFASKLLKSQPKTKLDLLMSQFPELQSLAADWEPGWKGYPDTEKIPDALWQNKDVEEEAIDTPDLEDQKIEAMHMAARAIKMVDKFDKFSREDIQEILNSLSEELDAV